MNYLGIDYGEVNYGFAIGNSITKNSTTYYGNLLNEKSTLLHCSPGLFFGRLGGRVGEWNFRKIEF